MLSHLRCFLGLRHLQCLWEAEPATGTNQVRSCSDQKGCFPGAGCLEQSRLEAKASPLARGVVMGGQVGTPRGSQRNKQALKGPLRLRHACALTVSPGTRAKISRLLILRAALSWRCAGTSSSAERCFSHALSSGSISLALIHSAARRSAPRGSSEDVTEVRPSLVALSSRRCGF